MVGLTQDWGLARPVQWSQWDREEEDVGEMASKLGGDEVKAEGLQGKSRPVLRNCKSQIHAQVQ